MPVIDREAALQQIVKFLYYRVVENLSVSESLRRSGDDQTSAASRTYFYATKNTPKWVLEALTAEQREWLGKVKYSPVKLKPFIFNGDQE